MINTAPVRFDRSVLLQAYLDAIDTLSAIGWKTGAAAEAAYADWPTGAIARSKSRLAYFTDLEKLFGTDLGLPEPIPASDGSRRHVVLRFLRSLARKYRQVQRPFDGYLEATLLVRALEEAGIWDELTECNTRMDAPAETLRTQYLETLDVVMRTLLGEKADVVYELDDPAVAHIVVPAPWDPYDD